MFIIKDWEQFQHYKSRNPPWIKLHNQFLSSREWIKMDDASKLLALSCMVLASRNDGIIDDDVEYIKAAANLRKTPNLKPLIDIGFLIPSSEVLANDSECLHGARIEKRREEERREEKRKNIKKEKVTLESLSVDHISEWLFEKRQVGMYIDVDEHMLLERFKSYCLSKGRTYKDYIHAFRNAFEWKGLNGSIKNEETKRNRAVKAALRAI